MSIECIYQICFFKYFSLYNTDLKYDQSYTVILYFLTLFIFLSFFTFCSPSIKCGITNSLADELTVVGERRGGE